MRLIEEPLFTTELLKSDFVVPNGATFIYGHGDEDRAAYADKWITDSKDRGVCFISIEQSGSEAIIVNPGVSSTLLYLHAQDELIDFLLSLSGPIYLDITALLHRSWAPLLRAALATTHDVRVVYLEPEDYHKVDIPTPGKIYDLSDRIGGIEPLPGFARLNGNNSDGSYFVPMVGFEGPRLQQVISSIETERNSTVPIIGLPGFRPEYLFYAYSTNRDSLQFEYLHNRVTYVKANCPFHAFHTLAMLHHESRHRYIRVAPIGTKPHAVGAVLYAISLGSRVEIIYDHPVKSQQRTNGEGRICIYDVSSFIKTELFTKGYENSLAGRESGD